MESCLSSWKERINSEFDAFLSNSFSSSIIRFTPEKLSYEPSKTSKDIESVLNWFQKSVNLLVSEQISKIYWDHFKPVLSVSIEDFDKETFCKNIENSLLNANNDLINAKNVIVGLYKQLFADAILQRQLANLENQTRFLRFLSYLDSIWNIFTIENHPLLTFNSWLDQKIVVEGLESSFWKKLVFYYFDHQFDLMFENQDQNEANEEEEVDETIDIDKEPKEAVSESFLEICRQFNILGFGESIQSILSSILFKRIESKILNDYSAVFDQEDQLKAIKNWSFETCLKFIETACFPAQSDQNNCSSDHLDSIESDVSLDSDIEDRFELLQGMKNVPSSKIYLPQIGFPMKDPTSSIKKPYGRLGLIGSPDQKPIQKINIADFSDFESDEEDDLSVIINTKKNIFLNNIDDDHDDEDDVFVPSTPFLQKKSFSSKSHQNTLNQNTNTLVDNINQDQLNSSNNSVSIPDSSSHSSLTNSQQSNQANQTTQSISMNTQENTPSFTSALIDINALVDLKEKIFPSNFVDFQIRQNRPNFAHGRHISSKTTEYLSLWKSRIDDFIYEVYCKLRMSEMFDIIVDFPDSLPTLKDLRQCLLKTQQFGILVQMLRESFLKRLLHPGANTSDILTTYISTIKAIRTIDPSGVLLFQVSVDLKTYLRQRKDALRAVVSVVTEDGGESGVSLISELEDSESSQYVYHNDDNDADSEDDQKDDEKWSKWTPNPIIPSPGSILLEKQANLYSNSKLIAEVNGMYSAVDQKDSNFGGAQDTISTLVSIFENKELFLDEYSNLLGERLLYVSDFNTDKELKNVELLKLKFGENSMQTSEIMLKDMAESKRTNAYIHNQFKEQGIIPKIDKNQEDEEEVEKTPVISAAIISHMFWPSSLTPQEFLLPPDIQKQRESYNQIYSKLKASRYLEWYDSIGTVEIELEFAPSPAADDGDDDEQKEPVTVEFKVTPIQATVIMLFQEQPEYTLDELMSACKAPEDVIRKCIQYWISNGIIKEISKNQYRVVETLEEGDGAADAEVQSDGEGSEPQDDFSDTIPYIIAMLKNLGALSLSRIHQMMNAYSADYALKIQELEKLLNRLVEEETLHVDAGTYSIKKQKK